jgi:hypothetical protein
MAGWHLYGEFKNGESTGGRIQFVWLFGLIGGFVLLLAAINFMNLSTARSATRAREVGIRKAIGSMRIQLVGQFLSESWLVVTLAFGVSLLLVQLVLPGFNQLAGKHAVLRGTGPRSGYSRRDSCCLPGCWPAVTRPCTCRAFSR